MKQILVVAVILTLVGVGCAPRGQKQAGPVTSKENEQLNMDRGAPWEPAPSDTPDHYTMYEVDSDNDGISDGDELYVYSTNHVDSDTDDDGISDGEEVKVGNNPKEPGRLSKP